MVFSYLPSLKINKENWGPNHHAKVIGIQQIPFQFGPVLLSLLYYNFFVNGHSEDVENQNLQGMYSTLWIMFSVACALNVILTQKYPALSQEDEDTEDCVSETNQLLPASKSNKTNVMVTHTTFLEGALNLNTQLVFWAQVTTASPGMVMLNNITVILQSFGWTSYSFYCTMLGPAVALIVKLVAIYISDKCVHKIPRVQVSFFIALPFFFFVILSIFWGDKLALLTTAFILGVSSAETTFAILPTYLAERFKPELFSYIYTTAVFSPTVMVLLLQIVVGILYDVRVIESTENICYGINCYTYTFLMLGFIQGVGLMCHLAFLWRRER